MKNKFKNLLSFESYSKNNDCDCQELYGDDDCGCGDEKTFEKKKDKKITYEDSGLKHPKKADLNKDGKLSSYELRRGKAIEDAISKSDKKNSKK